MSGNVNSVKKSNAGSRKVCHYGAQLLLGLSVLIPRPHFSSPDTFPSIQGASSRKVINVFAVNMFVLLISF